ncbi:outer membrane biogenesis protein BamB [Phycisphaerae bacterium RAS2]|nr:outer membrane biogenesis protein BamB [Phycisphaerae bacterium RAS2]
MHAVEFSTSPRFIRAPFARICALACTIALAVPAVRAAAADGVRLKPDAKSLSNVYVEHELDVKQATTGPDGKPMNVDARSVYGLLQTAKAEGDGMVLEVTMDRMLGYMSFSESMKSLYDSDDPDYEEASPMHKDAFNPVLNKSLSITIDAAGKATGVSGGDPIRAILKELGESNFVGSSLINGDLADVRIKSLFGESQFVILPEREVKVGDTWKKTQHAELENLGKVIYQYDCKLEKIEKADGREMAIIHYKGTVAKDPADKPAKDQKPTKMDGTLTGEARYDLASNRIADIRYTSDAKIEMPSWFQRGPDAPMMKIDTKATYHGTSRPVAERKKQKAEITERIAAAKAKKEAEEAAAMAGPVDPPTPANDPVAWLQWGGPDRDFKCSATGLANRWPKEGPPKLWERPLGDGFSCILCDGDTLYTMYSVRDKEDAKKGEEVVVALDAKTGKTKWEHKYDAPWPEGLQMEFGPGPHSTPLIVGDKLYTVGCTAILLCLDKKSGKVVWSEDLSAKYKADLHMRGYGASPLEYKGNILVTVSKEKGHAIIAFEKDTGKVAWKGGEFDPGYASLLAITVDGIEQLVAFGGKAVLGVDPSDGHTTWSIDHPTQWGANITTPLWNASDKTLFISSAYGMGSRGVQISKAGSQVAAKETWFNPRMKIQHATAVREGDWIYGSSGDFGPAFMGCVNAKTGEFGWRQRGIAKATVLLADGKLIVLDEDGSLFLVKADAEKYRLLGKMTGVCKKTAWTAPTLYGRTLYLRDREKIVAMDLGAGKTGT